MILRLPSAVRAASFCFLIGGVSQCLNTWPLSLSNASAQEVTTSLETKLQFHDASEPSGLTFVHRDGSNGAHYLVETIAAGLASFDYDGDGRIDVYFVNGAELQGTRYEVAPINELFRNLGQGKFVNVARASGLDDDAFGLGVTVGDYDNDGFEDVYLSNFGPNTMYHNNGDGTFSKLMDDSLRCGNKTGGGVSMFDMDGDGNLDIYAASYIQFDYAVPGTSFRGRQGYGGPMLYPKESDNLIRNVGDGSFVDVSSESGIANASEWGMATLAFDYDQDGDTDVFVANDSTRNLLWENDGSGHFSDSGLIAGLEFDHLGDPQGSMGVDLGDFDGDLLLDLYQTAYTKQITTLYKNDGGGFFQSATLQTGSGVGTFYPVNWGTSLSDFDNDGDKDIFVANGHIHDNMDDLDQTVKYKIANQLFENLNGNKFAEVSALAGSGLAIVESSRGIVVDDYDVDGDLDVIVLNSRTLPSYLENVSTDKGSWIELNLVGVNCNRSAVGAKVRVLAGGREQLAEVVSGRGYQSHFGSRLHFGLEQAPQVERLVVSWPDGTEQEFTNIESNGLYLVRQGKPLSRCEVSP